MAATSAEAQAKHFVSRLYRQRAVKVLVLLLFSLILYIYIFSLCVCRIWLNVDLLLCEIVSQLRWPCHTWPCLWGWGGGGAVTPQAPTIAIIGPRTRAEDTDTNARCR